MHKFQISFPYFSGLPKDVVQNTFHLLWLVGSPGPSDFTAAKTAIFQLYTSIFTNISTAGAAPWINPGLTNLKAYDLADPIPRAPVYNFTGTCAMTQSTTSRTVPEQAICLSYQGVKVSGLPQARRRGRIYIGAMGECCSAGGSGIFPIPTTTITTNICNAASALITGLLAVGWEWNVWSDVLQSGTAVTDGWVDNAFDTQRRRGNAPSSRQLWT